MQTPIFKRGSSILGTVNESITKMIAVITSFYMLSSWVVPDFSLSAYDLLLKENIKKMCPIKNDTSPVKNQMSVPYWGWFSMWSRKSPTAQSTRPVAILFMNSQEVIWTLIPWEFVQTWLLRITKHIKNPGDALIIPWTVWSSPIYMLTKNAATKSTYPNKYTSFREKTFPSF